MTNHRSKGGTENKPYPSDFYDCSAYTFAHQKRTHACSGHYIRTKAVRELVLETIDYSLLAADYPPARIDGAVFAKSLFCQSPTPIFD